MTTPVFDPTDGGTAQRFNIAERVLNEAVWVWRWEKILGDDPDNLNLKALAQLPHHYAQIAEQVPGVLDDRIVAAIAGLALAKYGVVWPVDEIQVDLAAMRDNGIAFRAVLEEKLPKIIATEIEWDTATQRAVEVVKVAAKADHPEITAALTKNRASIGRG